MENDNWVPPPPPEDSIFGGATRDHYAREIRSESTKALIFGILSLFCCPIVFGILGYSKANEVLQNIDIYQVEENRRGIAQAGKILSIVGIVIWVLSFALRMAFDVR